MAYQDDDRFGSDRWRDRGPGGGSGERGAGRDRSRGDYGRGDYRGDPERGAYRQDQGRGGHDARSYDRDVDDRGFIDRAGDELRSWFGDEEAQRRREEDNRRWEHEQGMAGRRTSSDTYGAYGDRPGGGWGNQQAASWHRDRPGEPGWPGASGSEAGEGDHHYGARGRTARPGSGGADTGDLYGYGRAPGGSSGFGAAAGGFRQAGGNVHDPHYSQWRQRQIDDLDRDYHEYRQENQSRFEQEFGNWRSKRQGQRQSLSRADEHMEVVGSDGSHVGTVDKLRGDRIILARMDPGSGGIHHSIPCSWVESVDTKVTLNKTGQEAKDSWRAEERSRALFEREDSGSDGPHALNRSFSGTYPDRDDRGNRKPRDPGSDGGARDEGSADG